jgi:methionyl-tRNA formyltransferase
MPWLGLISSIRMIKIINGYANQCNILYGMPKTGDNENMTIRSVFMGSPQFALAPLKTLARITNLVGIVTQPDRPAGRGRQLSPPPVKDLALAIHLPVIQPGSLRTPEAMDQLQAWRPDIIVVAAFGQILRQDALSLPPFGCINLHASLLPRYRGAAPIPASILAGEVETGVTLMKMDPGMDTGPILAQKKIPIPPRDTTQGLTEKLSILAAETLEEYLPVYIRGELTPEPQDSARATYAPQLKKMDGLLDFHKEVETLHRKVRAYFPWPGAFFYWNGQPIKVLDASSEPGSAEGLPGLVVDKGHFPAIHALGGILILRVVQPAGRKALSGDEFLRGARNFLGQVLE